MPDPSNPLSGQGTSTSALQLLVWEELGDREDNSELLTRPKQLDYFQGSESPWDKIAVPYHWALTRFEAPDLERYGLREKLRAAFRAALQKGEADSLETAVALVEKSKEVELLSALKEWQRWRRGQAVERSRRWAVLPWDYDWHVKDQAALETWQLQVLDAARRNHQYEKELAYLEEILAEDLMRAALCLPPEQVEAAFAEADQEAAAALEDFSDPLQAHLRRVKLQDLAREALERAGVFVEGDYAQRHRSEALRRYGRARFELRSQRSTQLILQIGAMALAAFFPMAWATNVAHAAVEARLAVGMGQQGARALMATRGFQAGAFFAEASALHHGFLLAQAPVYGSAVWEDYWRHYGVSLGFMGAFRIPGMVKTPASTPLDTLPPGVPNLRSLRSALPAQSDPVWAHPSIPEAETAPVIGLRDYISPRFDGNAAPRFSDPLASLPPPPLPIRLLPPQESTDIFLPRQDHFSLPMAMPPGREVRPPHGLPPHLSWEDFQNRQTIRRHQAMIYWIEKQYGRGGVERYLKEEGLSEDALRISLGWAGIRASEKEGGEGGAEEQEAIAEQNRKNLAAWPGVPSEAFESSREFFDPKLSELGIQLAWLRFDSYGRLWEIEAETFAQISSPDAMDVLFLLGPHNQVLWHDSLGIKENPFNPGQVQTAVNQLYEDSKFLRRRFLLEHALGVDWELARRGYLMSTLAPEQYSQTRGQLLADLLDLLNRLALESAEGKFPGPVDVYFYRNTFQVLRAWRTLPVQGDLEGQMLLRLRPDTGSTKTLAFDFQELRTEKPELEDRVLEALAYLQDRLSPAVVKLPGRPGTVYEQAPGIWKIIKKGVGEFLGRKKTDGPSFGPPPEKSWEELGWRPLVPWFHWDPQRGSYVVKIPPGTDAIELAPQSFNILHPRELFDTRIRISRLEDQFVLDLLSGKALILEPDSQLINIVRDGMFLNLGDRIRLGEGIEFIFGGEE